MGSIDMRRQSSVTAMLAVALLIPGPLSAAASDARVVVEAFVSRQVAGNNASSVEQRKVDAMLSPELRCLLRSTGRANKESMRLAPEEKPPFVDGNMFLPNIWEVPAKARILNVKGDDTRKVFAVEFSYGPDMAPDIGHYEMRRLANGWRVADLLYQDAGRSPRYQSLTALLYGRLQAYPSAGALKCKV
jgi:hypothetical protein